MNAPAVITPDRAHLLSQGLVREMPFEQYHAVQAFSATGMRHMARSPWHYRNRVETMPTRPMLRGTLAHCAVLEPDAMATRYAVVPEDAPRRPTAAQWAAKKPNESSQAAMDWWRAFEQRCEGKRIVSAADYAVTQLQLAALAANPTIAETLASGYGEASVFWIDEATGVFCKARPDWVHPVGERGVLLVDLKTTADESPNGFGRAAARMRHHIQRAHYIAGFERATGLKVIDFVFAAVTSAPPVLAVPYVLTDEVAEQGEREREELLARFAWCEREGQWPAYGDGVQMLDFPAYAKDSNEVEVAFAD